MKKIYKIVSALAICLVFCSLLVGYAVVNDQLNIFGSLSADGVGTVELTTGESFNKALAECDGVKRIIFDKYVNQASALNYANLSWDSESAVEVQSENSAANSIKLFWVSDSATVYVLSKGSLDMIANVDCSNMFSPASDESSTVEEIVFNAFDTSNTENMSGMFKNCSALTTVYVKENFNTGKTFPDGGTDNSADMFTGCYTLVGGEGTEVYPDGDGSAPGETGCTYARIDEGAGNPGYFTDNSVNDIVYFRSNLLKPEGESAYYNINGASAVYTLSNAIDSNVCSNTGMSYTLVTYVLVNDSWEPVSTKNHSFDNGDYETCDFTVAPVVDGNGVTHNKVKVMAQCMTGQLENIEAVFEFSYTDAEFSYRYDGSAIILTVITNDLGGNYTFAWQSGISPDNSDPNKIFTNVMNGDGPYTASLTAYTVYEFYFFVVDPAVAESIGSNEEIIKTLVTVTKS